MISKPSSKIIAAVLTAAMALSPVFMLPGSAGSEQAVESQASSWRYQDGNIIIEEGLNPYEADDEQDLQEDYNAQMGSSMQEGPDGEPSEELTGEPPEEETGEFEEFIEEDPQAGLLSATVRNRYWTWSKGKYKRGPGYLKGIDVSVWQGSINWKKVKDAGVDFAIIRCGYGENTSSKDDSKFVANVKGCEANGIPYGVYLYSYYFKIKEIGL